MAKNLAIVILSGMVVVACFRVPNPPVVKFYTPPPFGVQLSVTTAASTTAMACTLGIIEN